MFGEDRRGEHGHSQGCSLQLGACELHRVTDRLTVSTETRGIRPSKCGNGLTLCWERLRNHPELRIVDVVYRGLTRGDRWPGAGLQMQPGPAAQCVFLLIF
jgi:hypothetical protein